MEKDFSTVSFNNSVKIADVGPVCYLFTMLCSLINPILSLGFIIAVLVFYIFFSPHLVKNIPLIFNYK